ncbi:MAG: ribosome biogenesis/translation initiation ATPase RLI [Thermoprotei archaeon]|nr:MAG: ribosome biogenesis/translation initiation ATPase RLI [Thermoprotei archaeon]
MVRIAVIDRDLCKPRKCNLECIRFCPMVRSGRKAIEFNEELRRPVIHEMLCMGCGICVKKCPFNAIYIVNLPEELEEECIHRYGINGFKLYRLPIPKRGKILGIIGQNGVGKSTALKILSGRLKPNLGRVDEPPEWDEIIRRFRGTELQPYFKALVNGKLRAVIKPQYVDLLPKKIRGTVEQVILIADERGIAHELLKDLELEDIKDRRISHLSGGELQRLAIAITMCRDADVYLFDEPSSFLDVYQRMKIAKLIRNLALEDKIVVVVEHDLAVLDYISDLVSIIYGTPGAYGIVTEPRGVRVGINEYLDGYLPQENMRIREYRIVFDLRPLERSWKPEDILFTWPKMTKRLGSFKLIAEPGEAHVGEVIGLLGPNGIGKTTFIRLLAGDLEPDEGYSPLGKIEYSYKPQYIASDLDISVEEFIKEKGDKSALSNSWFLSEVIKPLGIDRLLDRRINELSGGELQVVYIAACLAKDVKVYLIDEPFAYLDVEQRFRVSRAIRHVVEARAAVAFVVEHDIIAHDFIADSLIVFNGKPGIEGYALAPLDLKSGMNKFLKQVGITFRRDLHSKRPRINKEGSYLDRLQKSIGEYYYVG